MAKEKGYTRRVDVSSDSIASDEARALRDYTDSDFLEDILNYLAGADQVDRPPAIGNAYELARTNEELRRLADRVIRTPEKGSLQYQDPKCPRKAMDMLGDTLCCVVHDKNDLDKEDMLNAVLLVHGKEKEAKVVQIGPRYFLTPGCLQSDQPTVAILEFSDKSLKFSAYTLDGATVIENQVLQNRREEEGLGQVTARSVGPHGRGASLKGEP